jgi:hypothetical protein
MIRPTGCTADINAHSLCISLAKTSAGRFNTLIGGIGVQTIFTAIIAVAITFTLSCSGSDDPDNGGGDAPSGGITNGTGSFSGSGAGEKAQVYYKDDDDGQLQKYTGNGDIQIEICDDERDNCEYIDAGKIEGGMVKLQLPSSVDAKYLKAGDTKNLHPGCKATGPANVKVLNANSFHIKSIDDSRMIFTYNQSDNNSLVEEIVPYAYYSSGPVNMNCSYEEDTIDGKETFSVNVNFAQGWNEVYFTLNCGKTNCDIKQSTDKSILKHLNDMKWLIKW